METIPLKEEKELLIAGYKASGEFYYPINARGRDFIQIGDADFPDDPENCDLAKITIYCEAFESLCRDGHIKHVEGLLYRLTVDGRKLAKELAEEEK